MKCLPSQKRSVSLTGLCAGGGGAWGGLKVEGLEKALLAQVLSKMVFNQLFNVSQLVRGVGSLVRLGARSAGWEAVATDYLELLVALAGRGHGEVEGAVVGGLAAVVALLQPTALREGSRFLPVLKITFTAPEEELHHYSYTNTK